jgi:hypothetical protein
VITTTSAMPHASAAPMSMPTVFFASYGCDGVSALRLGGWEMALVLERVAAGFNIDRGLPDDDDPIDIDNAVREPERR